MKETFYILLGFFIVVFIYIRAIYKNQMTKRLEKSCHLAFKWFLFVPALMYALFYFEISSKFLNLNDYNWILYLALNAFLAVLTLPVFLYGYFLKYKKPETWAYNPHQSNKGFLQTVNYRYFGVGEFAMGGPLNCEVILDDGRVLSDVWIGNDQPIVKQENDKITYFVWTRAGKYIGVLTGYRCVFYGYKLTEKISDEDFFYQTPVETFEQFPKISTEDLYPFRGLYLPKKIETVEEKINYSFSNGLAFEATSILPQNLLQEDNPLFALSALGYYKFDLQNLEYFADKEDLDKAKVLNDYLILLTLDLIERSGTNAYYTFFHTTKPSFWIKSQVKRIKNKKSSFQDLTV